MKDSQYDTPMTEETPRPLHTFGGRGLDRYVYDFETPDGLGGSEVAPAPVEPVTPVEPVEPVTPVEPVAPTLTRDEMLAAAREAAMEGSSEAFRAFVERAEAEERARAASVAPTLPEWDPYDPNVVLAHMTAAFTPLFRQLETAITPAANAAREFERREGETQANTLLDTLKTGDDALEFDNARAIAGARAILAVDPSVAPEEALKRAARDESEYIAKYALETLERMGVVAEAHRGVVREPGASGGAAAGEVVEPLRGRDAYREQLKRSLASRGIRPGVSVPA